MSRFFVPVVFVALMSGLAFGLIVGVVARSPETHANVRPEGFDRTPIGYVGEEIPYTGIGLADPRSAASADPVARGRLLFLGYGCAACHGLASQGGVIGPNLDLEELFLDDFRPVVRSGPGGMPAFTEEILSDDDLDAIYAFLKAIRQEAAATSDGSTWAP
ncbi:MAG: cytochrome c [Candidatus Limnocylindrales bacterium]|nr:cytochrome c [Candidatus Limnocylindrales bacterium]